jgi:hypothetical protein
MTAEAQRVLMRLTCPTCGVSAQITDTFLMAYSSMFNCIVELNDRQSVAQSCVRRDEIDEEVGGKIHELVTASGRCCCPEMSAELTRRYMAGRAGSTDQR